MPVRIQPDLLRDDDFPVSFGRYKLLGVLGEGGMARVFRAELQGPAGFRKKTALKVIRASIAAKNEKIRRALINEARLGGLLKHPNIIDTYEFGEVDGQLYIAMELVDGIGLDALLDKEGKVPPHLALEIAIQMCSGLDMAHNMEDDDEPANLVHRDLKPSNVIITRQGLVKVMDFGIAKAATITTSMTDPGMTKGTPAYMSPEQASAKPLDRRSDLFAMGSILFEMITGRPFFDGETVVSLLLSVVHVEEKLIQENIFSQVDYKVPGLGDILRRCLRKDRRKRFEEANELEEAIKQLQRTLPIGIPLRNYIQDLSYEIIVSKNGTGHTKSISAALRKARNGTKILVRPGRYKETLKISKQVEIVGDGPRKQIIVGCFDDDCIVMDTERAVIRGLTLRVRPGKDKRGGNVVRVPEGTLILEDCDIKSYSMAGVLIEGENASPVLRRCRIHDGAGPGVIVRNKAQATIEQCEISGNFGPGVLVEGDGNPLIRRCRFHHGKGPGILVKDVGLGTIEDCDIAGNVGAGIWIRERGKPTIRRSLVHHTRGDGIVFEDHAEVGLELCDIFSNFHSGLRIGAGAQVGAKECQIHDCRSSGVLLDGEGKALLEECEIFGNRNAGVEARAGGRATVHRSRIRNGGHTGVLVYDGGIALLDECELADNGHAGVISLAGGRPELTRCKIVGTRQGSGIIVGKEAGGLFEACEVEGSGHAGVLVREGGAPTLRGCRIHRGRQSGVHIAPGGGGVFENCHIEQNERVGLLVADGASPTLKGCHIHGGRQSGVLVLGGGEGLLDDCEIYGNAYSGVEITDGAKPTLRSCSIRDNMVYGVIVDAGGGGEVTDCTFSENRAGRWSLAEGATLTRTGS